jgi:NADH-quinone oxidoreductase subunit N
MNAPQIWIILPVLAGIALYFIRRWQRISVSLGTSLSLILAGLARFVPIDTQIDLGPLSFEITSTFNVLGRRFVLENEARTLLVIIFVLAAFWFAAAFIANAGENLVPLGLVVVGLWIAALAVEPFLYAALLIEMTVLVCIPILVQPGTVFKPLRGSLRFLIFQTLGMLFLLLTGWLLTGVEATPGVVLAGRVAGLMGFGFTLLLGIFPFHSWILMLAEEAQPYANAFVLTMFTWIVTLYGLRFLDRYMWMRGEESILLFLRFAGVMMVCVGGFSAIFERHLGRIFGYAVLLETGLSLLAMSLEDGSPIVFAMLLPRLIAMGTWAVALETLRKSAPGMEMINMRGLGWRLPVASGSLILAQFSMAGMPLLAGFPTRWLLFDQLTGWSIWATWLCVLGSSGIFVAAVRTMITLVSDESPERQINRESWQVLLLLGLALLALFVVGVFPNLFLPGLAQGLVAFENLWP